VASALPDFVAVVGGTGLAAGRLERMKPGSGKGCCSIVLVCDDCQREINFALEHGYNMEKIRNLVLVGHYLSLQL
jgi:hypothetical protein